MHDALLETVSGRIALCSSYEELGKLREEVRELLEASLLQQPSPGLIRQINELHDGFMKRAVTIAESRLSDRGLGRPPVPYAFLLLGSAGRSEQTLWSDQDNGIVFADPAAAGQESADAYFAEFSREASGGLEKLGFAPCEGKVLGVNPLWRKPLLDWSEQFAGWVRNADWESVRYLLIAADMRMLHGDRQLFGKLEERFYQPVEQNRSILKPMLGNTLHRKVALGVFGQLIKERYGDEAGGIEVKNGAYIPLVNALRLLAIHAGLRGVTSSLDRINALSAAGHIPGELAEDWREAFAIALKIRALALPNGMLRPEALTAERKLEIKFCLHTGRALQRYVQKRIQDDDRA